MSLDHELLVNWKFRRLQMHPVCKQAHHGFVSKHCHSAESDQSDNDFISSEACVSYAGGVEPVFGGAAENEVQLYLTPPSPHPSDL